MYMDQLLNQLYEYRDTLSRDNAHYRGSVRAGATGAIAPVDFQKTPFAPIDFTKIAEKKENWTVFDWIRVIR